MGFDMNLFKKVSTAVALAIFFPGVAFADTANVNTGPILFGLAQITANQQFGTSGPEGIAFGGHRIRLGVKGEAVPGVTYMFQYKWDGLAAINSGGNVAPVGASEGVSTAYLNLNFIPYLQLQAGKFITPVGLERYQFGEIGNNLWFIQRAMNNDLLPNRSIGVMLHGSNILNSGISYHIGIFNNSSTSADNAYSAAHFNPIEGLAPEIGSGQGGEINGSGNYLFAGMLNYKLSRLFEIELSGATADALGTVRHEGGFTIPEARRETTWNVGIKGGLSGLDYMAEYTRNQNFAGVAGDDVGDYYVALKANLYKMGVSPYRITPTIRFDHYEINSNPNWQFVQGWIGESGQTLENLTLGVNYDLNPDNPYAARLQVNYILPMGNANVFRFNQSHPENILAQSGGGFIPFGAAIYNTLLIQAQVGF